MSTFIYKRYQITQNELIYDYIDRHFRNEIVFRHVIRFENFSMIDPNNLTVQRFGFFIGMSLLPYYYTLQLADQIVIAAGKLVKSEADFFNSLYKHGLAEFLYRNNLDFSRLPMINFDTNSNILLSANQFDGQTRNGYLVAHGGGKDSIVSGELLVRAGQPFSWFVMGYEHQRLKQIIKSINVCAQRGYLAADQSPHPYEYAKRFVKQHGYGYLGHKPMNAYLALLGCLVAHVNGFSGFVISNEASASEGNVRIGEVDINHQYSKSMQFEREFRQFMQRSISSEVEYFSLLRPFSEINIVQQFVKHPQYLNTFMSCNKGIETGVWCGECPKCVFVFLMLYAYAGKQTALQVFGTNLLESPKLTDTFLELAGMKGHKPFECVGEINEVRVLMAKIWKKGEKAGVVQKFLATICWFKF